MKPEQQVQLETENKIVFAEINNENQNNGALANLNEAHSRIVCEVETLVHEVRKAPRHRNSAFIKTALRRIAAHSLRALLEVKIDQ